MARWSAVVAGLLAVTAVILGVGCLFPVPCPLGPLPDVAFWEWSGRARLDDGPLRGIGAITMVTTRAGVPCAPVHADGAQGDVGFVPAGGSVSIMGIGPPPTITLQLQ